VGLRNRLFACMACSFTCMATNVALAQESSGPPTQGRTQEESLVYTDPTMAAPGHFLFGVSGEFLQTWGPEAYGASVGDLTIKKVSNVAVSLYGGDVYAGYGNWLLQFEGNTGGWTTHESVGDFLGQPVQATQSVPIEQLDGSVRYTFSSISWNHITPYVIAGVNYLELNFSETLPPSCGCGWTATGGHPVLKHVYDYTTPYIGAGMLYQMNDKWGFRFDIDGGYSWGSANFTNLTPAYAAVNPTQTSTGPAFLTHATVYYKITPELTAQVGVKGEAIFEPLFGPVALGPYVGLGYLHQF
jgi:hypothetical protein